jgi:nucleoside 2-deoxyribosyltransferase
MKYINKVYLSGGLGNDWHQPILDKFKDKFIFFNPRKHKLYEHSEYTPWDIHFVKLSDIIFAYLEKDNMSGYGLSLEIGFARALDKTIILVDERSREDKEFAERFKIVRSAASKVFENLDDGLKYLESFSR